MQQRPAAIVITGLTGKSQTDCVPCCAPSIGVGARAALPKPLEGATMLQKLRLLAGTLLLAVVSFPAEPADTIKPPTGYRRWFHVNTMIIDKASPLFASLGGMQNVYVNSVGETALKKGGPYPNKTMFVTDLHDFTISDGSYVEGARKALAVMVKDSKKYASTGGWGFQLWEGGDPKKPLVTDAAKQCFECHQPKKDQDYVYSTYIP
jgi:hypothetical protein